MSKLVKMPPSEARRRPRIALYSHDTCGLGHVRRNALLAKTLVRPPVSADVLMITGAREAGAFVAVDGIDVLTLPGLYKQADGRYRPRRFRMPLDAFTALRRGTIRAALEAFAPDLLVVDNVPRGARRELDDALAFLRPLSTRCVLGLRDVLDAPEAVRREWNRAEHFDAIRSFYDAVWVYGDPSVYDVVRSCDFPADVAARTTFVGYLDRNLDPPQEAPNGPPLPGGPFVLCAVGGGQDGVSLAEAFAASAFPSGVEGLILTGPFMPAADRERLERAAAARPDLRLVSFVADPGPLYRHAAQVVAMGGYNTVSELLSLGKRVLVVPRVRPRREQLIRAERMGRKGLLDWLPPGQATPEAISDWLRHPPAPPVDVRARIDMNGLDRIVACVHRLLSAPTHRITDLHASAHAAC